MSYYTGQQFFQNPSSQNTTIYNPYLSGGYNDAISYQSIYGEEPQYEMAPNQMMQTKIAATAGPGDVELGNSLPEQGSPQGSNVVPYIGAGLSAAGDLARIGSDISNLSQENVNQYFSPTVMNPFVDQGPYARMENPYQKGEGLSSGLSNAASLAGKGAALGSIGGPVGTAVGAGVGALVGGISGIVKGGVQGKKRKEFERAQDKKAQEVERNRDMYRQNLMAQQQRSAQARANRNRYAMASPYQQMMY